MGRLSPGEAESVRCAGYADDFAIFWVDHCVHKSPPLDPVDNQTCSQECAIRPARKPDLFTGVCHLTRHASRRVHRSAPLAPTDNQTCSQECAIRPDRQPDVFTGCAIRPDRQPDVFTGVRHSTRYATRRVHRSAPFDPIRNQTSPPYTLYSVRASTKWSLLASCFCPPVFFYQILFCPCMLYEL
jgi:predicted nucleic acid-binding Zn ribbon protein